jgi:hypothetical protein
MTREEAKKYAENMTYREAIYNLKKAKSVPYRIATFIKVSELLNELEQEPCKDAVSVASVFEIMGNLMSIPYDFDRSITEKDVSESMDKIRELPRVTPREPRKGHWIYDYTSADGHRTYHCSECGCYLQPKHSEPLNSFKWCSLCGADMREVLKNGKID